MLKIYNTSTKNKELFKPLIEKKVSLYVCGVTTYDYCHIGHARAYLAFDVVIRYLRYLGYEVTYVRNITDIDDKIIQRSIDLNEPYMSLAQRYILAMQEDFSSLNLLPPSYEPQATEYITHMIALIEQLLAKNHAYVTKHGDVYFKVKSFDQYGNLSKRCLEDQKIGARVEQNAEKLDPLDFVLWKSSKEHEPSWLSPWGAGRPGWHLECSAMSMHILGDHFDIHGGGMDLLFPHHENECAQSMGVGAKFVNTWMHVGFLQIKQEKMSKSIGNILTIREALALVHPEVLRFFMISSHYRSPLEYSLDQLKSSKDSLQRLYLAMRNVDLSLDDLVNKDYSYHEYIVSFTAAMNDDFNTPEALAIMFNCARDINRCKIDDELDLAVELVKVLQIMGNVLGILQIPVEQFLHGSVANNSNMNSNVDIVLIEQLISERNIAREHKQWQLSDQIRDQLSTMGIILEDTETGTIWRIE